jgi:phosphate transport system substrate-binding protein
LGCTGKIVDKEGNPILRRRGKTFSGWTAAILAALLSFGPRNALADTIRISGTGGAIGTIRFLGEAFRKVHPDIQVDIVQGMGSSGAIKAVLAGGLDIGLCSRPATEKERAQGAVDTRYARTPFVFGVHRTVKRTGLTLASVVEIYAGKRNRWEDGGRVRLVLRPPTDSDISILKNMSPEMNSAVEIAMRREGMIVAQTDQDAADVIENTPGAFGANTLALVLSEKRSIRVLALNGITPSVRAIVDGSYPYTKTFCMVTRKNPPAAVRRFLDFVRSPAAAVILAKYGQAAVQ